LPDVDTLVIGGGVVGLAVALERAGCGDSVLLLERGPRFGEGASTRNSGVIHSGIYYRPGSLKASLCVEGNPLLLAWCRDRGVPHRASGKLVVAADDSEVPALDRLCKQGEVNGVQGLEILDGAGLRRIEPEVAGLAALQVPSTGILDAAELVRSLAAEALSRGAQLLTDAEVFSVEAGLLVRSTRGEVRAARVVNCAGLFADRFAPRHRIHPCRGEYVEVVPDRRDLVRGLVYPAPHEGPGLGVHFTRTASGALLVGPNARYVEGKEEYEGGRASVESFLEPAQRLVPALRLEDLRPSYAGIRAKLLGEGETGFRDFVLEEAPDVPGLLNLAGIESPGLTCCLSLAKEVSRRF